MDYISKTDAIDCVLSQYCASSDETEEALGNAIEEIKKRSAADVVEHRKGRWVKWGSRVKCDQCNLCNSYEKPYCPNCGADMREVNE